MSKTNQTSLLALANVEALADDEVVPKDSTKVAKYGYSHGEWICYVTPGNAC